MRQAFDKRLRSCSLVLLWLLSSLIGELLSSMPLQAGPMNTGAKAVTGNYLLVADTSAHELYVFDISTMQMTGQLNDIQLAAHMGTVTVPDGRILMVDDLHVEFLALRIDTSGKPVIVGRAKIPAALPWNRAAWGSLDPGIRYFAFSSDAENSAVQTVTVVNLADYTVSQVEVPLNQNSNGAYEELHVYLAGNPLNLFVTTGEQVRAYALSNVLNGSLGTPLSVQAIPINSHGPGIQHGTQRLYSATNDGFAVLDITGGQMQTARVVSWNVGNVTASQDFRPRLSFDGGYIYGAVTRTPAPPASQWADTQNFIHAVDLRTERARLISLAPGSVGRFSLSGSYALFWNIHPSGDHAFLLDINPSSPAFQQIVSVVPLAKLSNGPIAGQPTTGKESRAGTITPDGRWAFVSQGGDGAVSVIDTSSGRVAAMLSTPTSLSSGGYLVAVQPGTPTFDTHAR